MKKHSIKLLIIFILISLGLPIQTAWAETLEENLNNLVGPKVQYNTMLSPVYLRNNTSEESISPQSGNLSLVQTDYVLPGRNGLNLEIKRIYNSGSSNVKDMKVEYSHGAWVDIVYSDANTSSFNEDRYDLGIGMRFSFPAMEVKRNSDGTTHMFLHSESGDVYRLKQKFSEGVKTYIPENQTIEDVVILEDTGYSNGQGDGTSKFMMVGKDGKKTWFSEDGRVLGIVDRYGNTIKFEYITQNYTIDGTAKTKKLISRITDTVGRVVAIDYNEDYSFKVGPVQAQSHTAENSYMASQDPNSQDSGDLQGKFQVVITLPDGKKITYDKTAALVSNSKQVIRTRLQRVYDIDGEIKYHYWYEQPELGFTYMNKDKYTAYNRYENLIQVDYRKENRLIRYTYDKFTKKLNGNEGSIQYRKIVDKKELAKTGFDDTKKDFMEKFIADMKGHETYSYTNEADGYGTGGYKENEDIYLKDTFRYYTEKSLFADTTDSRSIKVKYTYNGIHETVESVEAGSDHQKVTVTEYDEMKFPKKIEVTLTNIIDGQPAGQPLEKIENYRYDKYGNLTNYTGPLAQRDENGYPVENDPHMVVYSYDYDRFHVLTLKTWRQDENTINQTRFTPDEKGSILREEKVHTGDTVNYVATDFRYDSYGNMIQKTVNSPEQDYVTYYEYGTDLKGVDQKGAFLTKAYSVADGEEIAQQYAYNPNTGNITAQSDGEGNETKYEYDALERVIKVINPDTTEKLYSYIESPVANTKVEYTDPEGFRYQYEFDILGRQLRSSVYGNNTWKALTLTDYDFRGNKLKETDANGNNVRFTYDSADRLLQKEYYGNDSSRKEQITLSYTLAPDGDTSTLVTQADEEGYLQKYHYDILNRLVKHEVSPVKNNPVFHATTYTYNFMGNLTHTADARDNTTQFRYDDLGRLVKKVDARGNETNYTYNNLDRVLRTEEPGGRTVQNSYDALGRLAEERIYSSGSDDYIYTRYTYDRAGNIEMQTQGSVASGTGTLSLDMTFLYDSMNRLEDTWQRLDDTRIRHIRYAYDNNGNKREVTEYINEAEDQYIKSIFDYDFAGRTVKAEGYLSATAGKREGYYLINYTRDYAGNVLFEDHYNQGAFDTIAYTYDHRNRMLTRTEPHVRGVKDKTTYYSYDGKGNMTGETVTRIADGQEISSTSVYTYDGTGKLTAKANAFGYTATYVYDENGNLIKEIDPRHFGKPAAAAPGLEYEYDELNRLVKTAVFDGAGRTVISYREYDGRSNIILQADGEGYNPSNPSASVGSRYEYDGANRIVRYISAQTSLSGNFSKKSAYDGSGRVLSEEDGKGNIIRYAYYLDGSLKETRFPDNTAESYEYDLSSKAWTVKRDKNGNRTTTFRNVFGKPYRVEYPDNTVETFKYDDKGNMTESRDRAGNPKYFEYDASGNLLAKKEYVSSDGTYDYYRQTAYGYDPANSLLSSETFGLKLRKQDGVQVQAVSMSDRVDYVYDKAGRLVKSLGPAGRETRNTYDTAGNLLLKEDRVTPEGEFDAVGYTYDTRSRVLTQANLVKTEDIDLNAVSNILSGEGAYSARIKAVTAYEYYSNNQLKSRKDPNGNVTKYEYDYDGRLVKKIDPLNNFVVNVYDITGNLIEQKDEKRISIFYEYDALNRLIRKKVPSAGGDVAVTRYIYDANGNLVKEISPNDYAPAYDTAALANTMTGMSYAYDTMNRRITTISPDGEILRAIQYNSNGNVAKTVDGLRYTGSIETSPGTAYQYDGLGRAVSITDALGNSTAYDYDVLGRLIRQTDARGNATVYEYNPEGTLKKATFADGGAMEYTYDRLGRKLTEKDQRGNVTGYAYNAFGKMKSMTDAYGKSIEYKYDLNGNLVIQKDRRGSSTYFSYDANNRLKETRTPLSKDASGNFIYAVEKYIYDEKGNITKKTLTGTKDKLSLRETYYTYYDNGQVATVSDSGGASLRNYYDKNGNVIKTERLRDKDSFSQDVYDIQKFRYDAMNRLTQSIKLVDKGSLFSADSLPDISLLTDTGYPGKIQVITGFEYDILGNRTKEIEARGYGDTASQDDYTVNYGYDALNRLEKITRMVNGELVSAQYFFDEAGNKIRELDTRGFERAYSYDSMNRLKTATDALGNTFTYEYDLAGNKVKDTNAKSYSMTYTYDRLNRLETITDPEGIVISRKEYDANGNLARETDARDNGEIYTYDLANRLILVIDREGGETKYEYNQYGDTVRNIDGLGSVTAYEYDEGGRLVKVTDANGVSVRYSYDKAGNKLTMTDGRGKVTTYAYGDFKLLTSVTDADRKTMTYQYDLAGNVEFLQDKAGYYTLYTYDNRSLLLGKEALDTGDSISYTYDEAGNRTTMTDDSGTSVYSYDGNHQLLGIVKEGAPQISYTYDGLGNIATVTDAKGFVTGYGYDKSSRMTTVNFGGKTTVYTYDRNGNRASLTYNGGVNETYTYDKNDRVTDVYNKKPDGSVISQYTYTYDRAGRQTSKTDSFGTTHYTYDKAGRILKVEVPGKTTVYAYDLGGNRASQSETYTSAQPTGYIDGGTEEEVEYIIKRSDYVYSDANKLLRLTERMYDAANLEILRKTVQYYYDDNGNQLSEVASFIHPHNYRLRQATKGSLYSDDMQNAIDPLIERVNNTFDGFNRLKAVESVKSGTRTITEFLYNGDDLRVSKVVKSSASNYEPVTTNYLYDRQHVVLETDENDNVKVRYIRGVNYIGRVWQQYYSYYLYNGHGDVVQTVSEVGEVENTYDYDIWGNPTLTVELYGDAIRYAGEFFDNETGLYYLRTRYYNSYIGRFISEDSYWGEDANPLSLNLYTYCHNDPINFTDPTGHWEVGDSNLSNTAQSQILALTSQWYTASAADRETIHAQAQAIRDNPANYQNSNVGQSYYNTVSDVGKALDKVMATSSDGYISQSAWSSIQQEKADTKYNIDLYSQINGDQMSSSFWNVEANRSVGWHFGDETTQLYSRTDGAPLGGVGTPLQTRYDGVKALQGTYMTGYEQVTVYSAEDGAAFNTTGNAVWGMNIWNPDKEGSGYLTQYQSVQVESYGGADKGAAYFVKGDQLWKETHDPNKKLETAQQRSWRLYNERVEAEKATIAKIAAQIADLKASPKSANPYLNDPGMRNLQGTGTGSYTGANNGLDGLYYVYVSPYGDAVVIFDKDGNQVATDIDTLQTTLDVAGMIPVIGEPFDGINAGIYAIRGDYINATLSGAAVIPIFGVGATTGKYVNKADDIAKAINKIDNAIEGAGNGLDGVRIINKKYAGQTFELSGDLAKKYPNGVKFTNDGFPDFSSYGKAKVKLDGLKGNTTTDFTAANRAAGLKQTPNGYTWHHVEDGQTMMLVPTDLHQAVRHTGGASLIQKGIVP